MLALLVEGGGRPSISLVYDSPTAAVENLARG
jgi:hypothetical protein